MASGRDQSDKLSMLNMMMEAYYINKQLRDCCIKGIECTIRVFDILVLGSKL